MPQNNRKEKILVIKLSALGDFIQALGPMAAIRNHHPDAHITLMTTQMFKSFGEKCGYFDEIWIDDRPNLFEFLKWIKLRKKLINGRFQEFMISKTMIEQVFISNFFLEKTVQNGSVQQKVLHIEMQARSA